MAYVILAIVIIIGIIIYSKYNFSQIRKKNLQKIRSDWGKPKDEQFNFHLIGRYANTIKGYDDYRISDQTINDIDFYELFSFIDRTTSSPGQQYLFASILQPTASRGKREALEAKTNLINSDLALREKIQKELVKLARNAYHIPTLLQDKLIDRPKWLKFLIVSLMVIVLLLLGSIKFPILLIFLTIPIVFNMMVHYWNKSNAYSFAASFPELSLLIDVSKNISDTHHSLKSNEVDRSISELRSFQKELRILSFGGDGGVKDELSQFALYLAELIKAFFLIEVFTFFRLIKTLEQKKESISVLFSYVGEIDMAISVLSLRAGALPTCQPEFLEVRKEFVARNAYHPLIKNCVKNDLSIKSKSILITGSNMSGKSTFLRVLIINSLLAQSINTCFADKFITPYLRSFSSIRINDNLLEGKSLYFEEVSIIGSLIAEVNSSNQNFFILDEVFKGTNTIERIAAAKAILSYLNKNENIVIVSTHDIELAKLLENEYDLYHFTETIEDETLHFDHKLKPGQLKTRNAIKVLELAEYPKEIIEEAKSISSFLEK